MKTKAHFLYLAHLCLEWQMSQIEVVEKIKTSILSSVTFSKMLWVLKPFRTQRCQLIQKHLMLRNYEFFTPYIFEFYTILTTQPIISLNNISWFVCQLQTNCRLRGTSWFPLCSLCERPEDRAWVTQSNIFSISLSVILFCLSLHTLPRFLESVLNKVNVVKIFAICVSIF